MLIGTKVAPVDLSINNMCVQLEGGCILELNIFLYNNAYICRKISMELESMV